MDQGGDGRCPIAHQRNRSTRSAGAPARATAIVAAFHVPVAMVPNVLMLACPA